jgi:hypothetical protein
MEPERLQRCVLSIECILPHRAVQPASACHACCMCVHVWAAHPVPLLVGNMCHVMQQAMCWSLQHRNVARLLRASSCRYDGKGAAQHGCMTVSMMTTAAAAAAQGMSVVLTT